MAENHNRLKFVALGITTHCSHNCSFCYETAKLNAAERRDGDLRTLMQIGDKLVTAGVKTVELVGGDPAEHPEIERLTRYLKRSGLDVAILSNTHRSWHEVAPYVKALEWTVHGPQEVHDGFTKPRAYEEALSNLKRFAKNKRSYQQIGITLNFTSTMTEKLFETVSTLAKELPIDYVQLQRIAPFGGAAGCSFCLTKKEVVRIFEQIRRVDEELGIDIEVVDSFPLCILPEELRKYTARCDWGFGTAYVDMKGNLSRCAVNQIPLGNILNPDTPLNELWENHSDLQKFRAKRYLPKKCRKCKMLGACGGGCPSSCGGCELSADRLIAGGL